MKYHRKESMQYGYVRVSSKDQNEDRQIIALKKAGIEYSQIYIDKKSGKDFNRPAYNALIKMLKKDDVLFVVSIDRLGRNYEEILDQWRYLNKTKNIDIVVLDMPLLDTRLGKDLMGTFLSDIVLQLLSFVAENERKNIKERQKSGIQAARLRGVKFGRPTRVLPCNFEETVKSCQNKEITLAEGARRCNMPLSTFYSKYRSSVS